MEKQNDICDSLTSHSTSKNKVRVLVGLAIILVAILLFAFISNGKYNKYSGEYLSHRAGEAGHVRRFVFLDSKSGYYEINGLKYWFEYKISSDNYVTMKVSYGCPAYNGHFMDESYEPDNKTLSKYTYMKIYDFSD